MTRVPKFYLDGSYLAHNPDWHVSASLWKSQVIWEMMRKQRLKPETVAEIGCGAGEILRLLQERMEQSTQFTGYDIAPQAIQLAQERANQHLQFKLQDYAQQPEGHFNLLLLIDVVTHFENCFDVLRSLRGRSDHTIFQIALDISVLGVLGNRLVGYRKNSHHTHYWDKNLALDVLKEVGYEILDYRYTRPPLDLVPWSIALKQPRKLIGKCMRLCMGSLRQGPAMLLYLINKDFAVRFFGGWRLLVFVK